MRPDCFGAGHTTSLANSVLIGKSRRGVAYLAEIGHPNRFPLVVERVRMAKAGCFASVLTLLDHTLLQVFINDLPHDLRTSDSTFNAPYNSLTLNVPNIGGFKRPGIPPVSPPNSSDHSSSSGDGATFRFGIV